MKHLLKLRLLFSLSVLILLLGACGTHSDMPAMPSEESADTHQPGESTGILSMSPPPEKHITIPVKSVPAPAKYFNDAVFIGDSISEGLKVEAMYLKNTFNTDYFGKARFLTAQNFGLFNALRGSNLPLYKGEKQPIWKSIAQMDITKIYICLGMNDLASFSVKEIISNYKTVIKKLLKAKPGAKILIQSLTPITRSEEKNQVYKLVTKARLNELNQALCGMAEKDGYYYLDIYSVIKDNQGFLADKETWDLTCHMRPEALARWIKYLRTHTVKD